MLHIYIIEDEPLAAEKLRLFVRRAEPDCDVRIFHDGLNALSALQDEVPELIFLDIEMPGLTGIELLERLQPQRRPQVIITSAYEKYALAGFQLSVTDYLLKPYTYERLVAALGKAKEALRLRDLDSSARRRTLTFRSDLRTEVVDMAQIIYVEAMKDYVRIVTPQRKMMTQQTLSAIEELLPADTFLRIHRSYIVNREHVVSYSSGEVTLSDGTTLGIGKTYREQVKNVWLNHPL
jgi:DNA-binding LytR/AlgR family response regulator